MQKTKTCFWTAVYIFYMYICISVIPSTGAMPVQIFLRFTSFFSKYYYCKRNVGKWRQAHEFWESKRTASNNHSFFSSLFVQKRVRNSCNVVPPRGKSGNHLRIVFRICLIGGAVPSCTRFHSLLSGRGTARHSKLVFCSFGDNSESCRLLVHSDKPRCINLSSFFYATSGSYEFCVNFTGFTIL